jgi:hypothetical protein
MTASLLRICFYFKIIIKHHGQVFSTLALCLGGLWFKSRFRDHLTWLRFLKLSLSTSREMLGYYLKVCHNCFLPHTFQLFINHPVIIIIIIISSVLCNQSCWQHWSIRILNWHTVKAYKHVYNILCKSFLRFKSNRNDDTSKLSVFFSDFRYQKSVLMNILFNI